MTIQGAISELQNLIDADDIPFYYKGGIEKVIETITTDAIEVVRCKDCKHSIDYYNDGDCYCRHPKYNGDSLLYIQDGWGHYCSYAERKDK